MRDDNEESEDHDVDREEGTFDSPERDEPSFLPWSTGAWNAIELFWDTHSERLDLNPMK
jgi:hypothetical protein